MRRVTGRRHSQQTTGVDGIKRHVGSHGGVYRGADLRLIVDAGLADAARKINQRLLFGKWSQLARGVFQRAQLAIGIENIELGVIGGKLPAVVGGIGSGGRDGRQFAGIAHAQRLNGSHQGFAIVAEFLHHAQFVGERHDFHGIRRGHLRVDELEGGVARANLLGGLHGRKIEEHGNQPPVLEIVRLHRRGRCSRRGSWSALGFRRSTSLQRGCGHFQGGQSVAIEALHFENRDLLRLAVFEQGELILFQVLDRFAIFIFYGHVDDDQVRVGPEGWRRLVLRQQSRAG